MLFEGGGYGILQEFHIDPERTYRVRVTARITGERNADRPAVVALVLGERFESLVISSRDYETRELAQLSQFETTGKGSVELFDYNLNGGLQVKSVTLERIPTSFSDCFALIDADLRANYPFTDSTRKDWDDAVMKYGPLAARAGSELEFHTILKEALGVLNDATLRVEWQRLSDVYDGYLTYQPPGAAPGQLMDLDTGKHRLSVPCGCDVRYRGKQD